ncbi:MAG: hypothetical protein WCX71_00970 [Candidatus Buchananbacteria bacterium]
MATFTLLIYQKYQELSIIAFVLMSNVRRFLSGSFEIIWFDNKTGIL